MDSALGDAMLKLKPIFAGDLQVEDETARPGWPAMRKELLRVFECPDLIPLGPEKSFDGDADQWFVIDHEYDGCFGCHGAPR
jgi:hypothetical protein